MGINPMQTTASRRRGHIRVRVTTTRARPNLHFRGRVAQEEILLLQGRARGRGPGGLYNLRLQRTPSSSRCGSRPGKVVGRRGRGSSLSPQTLLTVVLRPPTRE